MQLFAHEPGSETTPCGVPLALERARAGLACFQPRHENRWKQNASINPKGMWGKDQMGGEDECVFSGTLCFLQSQICEKSAEPTWCLMAESGLWLEPWSWENCIHLPQHSHEGPDLHWEPSRSCELWLVWKCTQQCLPLLVLWNPFGRVSSGLSSVDETLFRSWVNLIADSFPSFEGQLRAFLSLRKKSFWHESLFHLGFSSFPWSPTGGYWVWVGEIESGVVVGKLELLEHW